ncbi:DNA replication complex GINS protein SLD5-like [Teleopsis dalmanni]|uniref:DNA replication complex GINS protein SLD5-like n=1 Tax=Teleopsis dalmanni TaxID=139649 RepID=UPI000D32B533|nr:DNA replication complex GINS protein SLD5-like [Teleopsis dalmanni]XP_037953582.1 DNA replication complex GINS protein SLD5-like [Teleopsis dalmanni]XP_037953583.1 DNA replication complex GINS protein SLD5-like [Teleopsis dalmanni]
MSEQDLEDIQLGVEEDEEELITAQKVLEFLETSWRNELNAPEILPHQSDMLELMMGQVVHMEENMKDLDKNDFRYITHRMELERIRYVMASYLRCRLQKIETYTRHILNEEANYDTDNKRLSPEETKFAQELHDNTENYFNQVALQYMPNMQRSDAEQRIVRPNVMSHVFVKAKVSVPSVVVGVDDEEVDFAAGSQHIIPYQLIADLVQKNQAELI